MAAELNSRTCFHCVHCSASWFNRVTPWHSHIKRKQHSNVAVDQSRRAVAAHQSRRAAVTAVTVRQLLWLTWCQNRKKDIVVQRACPIGLWLPSLRLPCTGRAPAATRRSAPWVSCHRSVPNAAWCWGCPGLWNSRGPETRLQWSTLQAAAAFGWHERLPLSAMQAHALGTCMHAHASELPSSARLSKRALQPLGKLTAALVVDIKLGRRREAGQWIGIWWDCFRGGCRAIQLHHVCAAAARGGSSA